MTRFDLRDVTVRREGRLIVDRVTATLAAGRCTALVGPSGAGKSTLLRLFNRLDDPTSGSLLIDGAALESLDVLALRRRVGLVGQRPVLVAGTVFEELRAGAPTLERERALDLLARVGLPEAMLDRAGVGLSGGEAQRICLARTLAVGPEVLLLDEPTSALDPEAARAVEETLCGLLRDGLTAVLVSHSAEQVRRMADDVLVLREGRLVESGAVADVAYVNGAGGSHP
ncbi:ABC transporter ATP-binding protein [Catenulispora subtropica]|uniref:Phosphate ABC transporter ATP-binding protein n=1 Tax=Catenulispora subtropica TaxID=450798 RepID=A0ABN2QSF1_9ACTN